MKLKQQMKKKKTFEQTLRNYNTATMSASDDIVS